MESRFDRIVIDTTQIRTASDGAMVIPCQFARVGIQEYEDAMMPGGLRLEMRAVEDVEASASTFEGVLITDLHPPDSPYMITPATARGLGRGHLQGVTFDGTWLRADAYIHDQELQSKIRSGERPELSAGYFSSPLAVEGEAYHVVQKAIQGNHVASIPAGTARAGPEARLLLDIAKNQVPPSGEEIRKMEDTIITIGGVDYPIKADQSAVQALRLDLAQRQDAEVEAEKKEAEGDAAQAKIAELEAKIAELEAQLAEAKDPVNQDAWAFARADMVLRARALGGEDLDVSGSSTEVMSRALVKRGRKVEGKSDAYIEAAFDLLEATPTTGGVDRQQASRLLADQGGSEPDPWQDVWDARDRYLGIEGR